MFTDDIAEHRHTGYAVAMNTSVQIETTVQKAADALARSGASGEQRVHMTILSTEDAAKLDKLRASLRVAMQGETLSDKEADAVFDEILEEG